MKSIPGFNRYLVSKSGHIFVKEFRKDKNANRPMKMTPYIHGYVVIGLLNNKGKQRRVSVHRIVAKTFIPNPNKFFHVIHKNGVRTDNRVCNLEWSQHSQSYIENHYN